MLDPENINRLLISYKYIILFPISTIEGPIAGSIAGFLCSLKILNIYMAYAVLMAGDMTGDIAYYLIGRYGGKPLIKKWNRFLKIDDEKIGRTGENFKMHPWKILLFAKTQVFGALFLTTAGITKLPFRKYILINFLGSAVKIFILLLLGFYFGQAYATLNKYFGAYAIISILIAVIGTILYLLIKRKKNEKNNNSN